MGLLRDWGWAGWVMRMWVERPLSQPYHCQRVTSVADSKRVDGLLINGEARGSLETFMVQVPSGRSGHHFSIDDSKEEKDR